MEYLDPEKKRKHRQRIAVGYVLIGLIITMVTIIILLAGYGYGFDRNTGEFVQNGIMFVDTKHEQAQVTLNGEDYGQTDLRLVLREGDYSLVAKRDGYREWSRNLTIKGGELRKLTYAMIIPETLQSEQQVALNEQPVQALQSIDKDRIVAWDPKQNQTLLLADISQNPATITRLSLTDLVATTSSDAEVETLTIKDIEFIDFDSSDQRVLSKVTIADTSYFWLINTANITESRNITNSLPSALRNDAIDITMIDRSNTRFYVFDMSAGEVYEAELRGDVLSLVTLPDINSKVLAFTSYTSDWMLYVTESDGDEGLVNVYFRQGDKTRLIKQMKTSKQYFLTLANNGSKPFMGVGATNEVAVFVYSDPIAYLERNPTSTIPSPAAIMPLQNLLNISISTDAGVLIAYNDSMAATYDFFSKDTHYRTLDHTLRSKDQLKWIDGQHYSYVDNGTAWVIDYDGSNQQQLTASSAVGIFYRADSEGYFSFVSNVTPEDNEATPSFAPSGNVVQETSTNSLVFTSLLTEADR